MIVRMAANGRLTIPSAIRRKLGMTARCRVNMNVSEKTCRIVLTPVVHECSPSLRGRYKG